MKEKNLHNVVKNNMSKLSIKKEELMKKVTDDFEAAYDGILHEKNIKEGIIWHQDMLSLTFDEIVNVVVEMAEEMKYEKPHVSSPENSDYMYSLAQFNRVAGNNTALSSLINSLTNKKCTCDKPHIPDRIIHRYNGMPCYVKDSMADPDYSDTEK